MIDLTKPIEQIDGNPATLVRQGGLCGATGFVATVKRRTGTGTEARHFRADGQHMDGSVPAIRNVVSATLDTTKQLQTVDGKPVSFIGKMADGRIVVAVTYPDPFTFRGSTPVTELRNADGRKDSGSVHSPDDVIVKVVTTNRYRNVYSDGTTGDTFHATDADAKLRSKYGKVRVGVLHQTLENGKLVRAQVTSGTPWFRSRSFPSGRAAVASDY